MLEKFICTTISKHIENVIHENHGITCLHDVCEDMVKVFIYLHVGIIDCNTLVCEPPTLTFPEVIEEFACTTITITDNEDPESCSPINIISF